MSKANAVGNNIYSELPMTRYPENLDKRGLNQEGGNQNLNLHENFVHYNMAEHVNALADAVMAIQKSLGIAPQLNVVEKNAAGTPITDTKELQNLMRTKTVKSRLDTMENKNFDDRYGGVNWVPGGGQTLTGHKHTGVSGAPSKISLVNEVSGLLGSQNINLAYNNANSLNGSKIAINSTKSESIDSAVNDKLSKKDGGVIEKNLEILGMNNNRYNKDFDSSILVGDKETDANAFNSATYKTTTAGHSFLNYKIDNLYYGKYVLIVRAKTNSLVNANLLSLSSRKSSGAATGEMILKGTEFEKANEWKNFYFVFDYNQDLKNGFIKIDKITTTASVKLSLDYAVITPVHPAIFDR